MMIIVIVSVTLGILVGYLLEPVMLLAASENLIVAGLCVLLFFVGYDLGKDGSAFDNLKRVGAKIFAFPVAVIFGTFAGGLVASMFLPITMIESLTLGSGFGWYSLAPIMIAEKSEQLSAMSFLHNVFRELFAILLIPIFANYVSKMSTIGLPGAPGMDICLPVVEESTNSTIVIYCFVIGLVTTVATPIFVGFFMQLL